MRTRWTIFNYQLNHNHGRSQYDETNGWFGGRRRSDSRPWFQPAWNFMATHRKLHSDRVFDAAKKLWFSCPAYFSIFNTELAFQMFSKSSRKSSIKAARFFGGIKKIVPLACWRTLSTPIDSTWRIFLRFTRRAAKMAEKSGNFRARAGKPKWCLKAKNAFFLIFLFH